MKKNNKKKEVDALLKTGKYTVEELHLLPDSILNDLYLKSLVESGEVTKEEIGKPWITYYRDRPHRFLNIDNSLYQNYVDANSDNKDGVALYDCDNDRIIKHDELKQLIDAFANGLLEYGIGDNSRVGVLVLGSYEEPMCLLSPNKNGSLVKYIDILKGPGSMKHDIEKSNIDILLIDENMLPLEPMINEKGLPVIVLNATKNYDNTKYLSFEKILNLGASKPFKDAYIKSGDTPSLIINSSGTTGIPKPIVHSNKTVNSATQKLFFTNYPMTRDNYIFKSIPSHIGLGSLTTLYSGLVSGTGVMSKFFTPEGMLDYTVQLMSDFKKILKQHDLDENSKLLLYTSPMFYRYIYANFDKIDDLSFLGALLGAGSKMAKEELENMNEAYSSKGCVVPICNGYGQNENAGAVALNDNLYNENGSAGYPVIGTEIKVVDIDSFEELPANKEGRIIERADSEFLYYEGMENETHKSKIVMPDGTVWFDTKDYGYYDENGFVFITGRASRVLIRSDLKISMDAIEGKIKSNPFVMECAIVTQKTNGIDEDPIAYVVLKEDYKNMTKEQLISQIQNSESRLSDFEMPIEFNLVDALPYLGSGKIDYQQVLSLRKTN